MLSLVKRSIALLMLLFCTPILAFLYVAVKLTSRGPFIFKQLRAGKDKIPFTFLKIRTMVEDAEKIKPTLAKLNEANGPVFKIRNDPRYTKLGKFLSHTGLDELPQLVNIIKGEMDFVGPRPLPVEEAKKIPKSYALRFEVLPGMTSPWIVKGAHKMSFEKWMRLDVNYARGKNPVGDVKIFLQTLFVIIRLITRKLLEK